MKIWARPCSHRRKLRRRRRGRGAVNPAAPSAPFPCSTLAIKGDAYVRDGLNHGHMSQKLALGEGLRRMCKAHMHNIALCINYVMYSGPRRAQEIMIL